MRSVSIIGIGRLGGALAIALSRAGFNVEKLVYRDSATAAAITSELRPSTHLVSFAELPAKIDSEVILIATGDPEISVAAGSLVGRLEKGAVVFHTSGSLSSEVLSVLAAGGHATGSMHPLVSVSDAAAGADNFANAFFCIEGTEAAQDTARSIAEALGGRTFSIEPEQKSLYHAAAVVASGHLVAVIDISTAMLAKCGIENTAAQEILFPLISTTLRNLQTNAPEVALTGSFARTDVAAIRRHIASIEAAAMDPVVLDIYLSLGERSLSLAESKGADPLELEAVRQVISIAKRKGG
jgi:predicted short-subunit dehydrogenase-like oxidoreductase (DUF2520 family)